MDVSKFMPSITQNRPRSHQGTKRSFQQETKPTRNKTNK
jgi:hypothetical protein